MKNNYLKYCLFPVALFIALVIVNLFCNAVYYSLFHSSVSNFIDMFIRFSVGLLSAFTLIKYLPFVAIATLFTIQYHPRKLDVRNIVYIIMISIINALIMCPVYLIGFNYLIEFAARNGSFSVRNDLSSILLGWRLTCYTLAIVLTGVVSHFYFKNYNDHALIPLSNKKIITLISITQALLLGYVSNYSISNSIGWIIRYFIESKTAVFLVYLAIFLINSAVLFVYFNAWNYSYLVNRKSLDNYAFKTTLSFLVMALFMLVFSILFSLIFILFVNIARGVEVVAILAICYLLPFVVFILIVRQSRQIIYIVLCCLFYFAPLAVLFFLDVPDILSIYGVYLGGLSFSLFVWCMSNKLSMKLLFK